MENTTVQPDSVLAKQADFARGALPDIAKAEETGERPRVESADERAVTHFFQCLKFGYRGWTWATTLTRVPHTRLGTVCETDLLPGEDASLAPAQTPQAQHLQPGDLGRKDATPYDPDDPFLDRGYETSGEDADELALWELGLRRKRVINRAGRDAAAKRWLHDLHSHTELDRNDSLPGNSYFTCGYLWEVDSSLRLVSGLCANAWSPDDRRVVAMSHTCGAHSEIDADMTPSFLPVGGIFPDDKSLLIEGL